MGATLITATNDSRTKKDPHQRKVSLLPPQLHHSYQLIDGNAGKAGHGNAVNGVNNENESEEKDDMKNDKDRIMLETLCQTLRQQHEHKLLSSATASSTTTSLVFPGTIGVEKVREYLMNTGGFHQIRDLSSIRRRHTTPTPTTTNNNNDDNDDATTNEPIIYVIKERLARGIDLPNIETVFLLGVPSNSASYTHLAGRTARFNAQGSVISFLEPQEIYQYLSILQTLGLRVFDNNNDNNNNNNSISEVALTVKVPKAKAMSAATATTSKRIDKESSSSIHEEAEEEEEDGVKIQMTTETTLGDTNESTTIPTTPTTSSWDLITMTKTTIKSKTVSELRTYLETRNRTSKGLLKKALVDSVLALKYEPTHQEDEEENE